MSGPDGTVLALLAIAAVGWYWHANIRVREGATHHARQACTRQDYQFLEGTVALAKIRPVRDHHGTIVLQRTYLFDYSEDGFRRSQGFVIFTGRRLEAVGFADDRTRADAD